MDPNPQPCERVPMLLSHSIENLPGLAVVPPVMVVSSGPVVPRCGGKFHSRSVTWQLRLSCFMNVNWDSSASPLQHTMSKRKIYNKN